MTALGYQKIQSMKRLKSLLLESSKFTRFNQQPSLFLPVIVISFLLKSADVWVANLKIGNSFGRYEISSYRPMCVFQYIKTALLPWFYLDLLATWVWVIHPAANPTGCISGQHGIAVDGGRHGEMLKDHHDV